MSALRLPEELPATRVYDYAPEGRGATIKVIEYRLYIDGAMAEVVTPFSLLSWGWWAEAGGRSYLLDERDLLGAG